MPDAHGLAGPLVGVHDDVLIVAGGANFPEGVPWHPSADGWTSPKRYHDRIFTLALGEPAAAWSAAAQPLARSLAYGVSVQLDDGVLCAGGERQVHERDETAKKHVSRRELSDAVFALRWHRGEGKVETSALPPLPAPTTSAGGARIGDTVYVVGGDSGDGATNNVWALDLSKRDAVAPESSWTWRALRPWPGPPRVLPIVAAQSDGRETCLFVFSGRRVVDGKFEVLTDAYKYEPSLRRWTRLAGIVVDGGVSHDSARPRCLMAGTGVAMGPNEIVVVGGADGSVLLRHENELPRQIAAAEEAGNAKRAAELRAERDQLYDRHGGFSRDVLQYNAVTDRWSKLGEYPQGERVPSGPDVGPDDRVPTGAPVTTTAVVWKGEIIVPTGEISPGVRSPGVRAVRIDREQVSFGVANWTILVLYLAVLVYMGFYFSRRERSTEDFFTAGGRIPWWAAGLSIFGTMLSAITYLSIPARAYGTDWSWFILNMGIVAVAPIVAFAFLPFFRRLRVTSAYEYLEARFHVSLRLFGSATFVFFQFGRMGIVVLLPALALSAVTGIDVVLCIAVMGVLSTLYTVLGGIEAVIWTDVLQVVVLVGGAIAAIVTILIGVGGELPDLWTKAWQAGKADLVTEWHSHDLSWAKDGILVILLGAVFGSILPYISDQAVIQRYLTVSSEREARRAIWTNAVLTIPASILFFAVGTALWIFYVAKPEALVPLEKADQIFPWFIALEMPAGIAGLVIAGVFAATMSSLDSSMHSIATAVTTDFYLRARPNTNETARLRFARVLTVVLGAVGTVSAILMARMEIKYLWDAFLAIAGLLLGTLGGLFTVGIFTRRCRAVHAWIGVAATVCVLYVVKNYTDLHFLLNGALSLGTCLIVSLLATAVVPSRGSDTAGRTHIGVPDSSSETAQDRGAQTS